MRKICFDEPTISYDKLSYWDSISKIKGLFACVDIILSVMTLVYLDTEIYYHLKDTYDYSSSIITLIGATQYLGFFATSLICHHIVHKFSIFGLIILSQLF